GIRRYQSCATPRGRICPGTGRIRFSVYVDRRGAVLGIRPLRSNQEVVGDTSATSHRVTGANITNSERNRIASVHWIGLRTLAVSTIPLSVVLHIEGDTLSLVFTLQPRLAFE